MRFPLAIGDMLLISYSWPHAIQAVVHDNDELLRRLSEYKEEGPTNLTWAEGDRWYGWTYNKSKNRYYFDDIGNESLMGLWEDQWAREEAESK